MSEMIRRVYVLPKELHSQIEDFAREQNFPSEVDAVRHLLKLALQYTELPQRLVERLSAMPATDACKEAVDHPLVATIEMKPTPTITLVGGEIIKFTK